MEAIAREKYVRISPIKVRRVIQLIKHKNVEEALNILHFTPKRAAKVLEKALRSAVANFYEKEEGAKIPASQIYIKNAYVDNGPMLRRFRPMSMGRVGRIRRRTSHITIILENKED
ncbi:MAG: 50S ribosomal protein L22 [Calditrichaeota bacterium]|nr:50S ribosomal protein L22 [Calditrichota bacterium]